MSRAALPEEIRRVVAEVTVYARAYGLDFFDTIFEMVDLEGMLEVASYGGFPNRYPHWRFGMDFEEMDRTTTYGLSRIYELVLNTDPCYAYLLRSNSLTEQKIVIAHVLGHSDFFKNNQWFSATNRKMLDEMANHAMRVRRIMDRVGVEEVEEFLDTCLSLENLLDIHSPFIRRESVETEETGDDREEEPDGVRRLRSKDYMDSYINPEAFLEAQRQKVAEERARRGRVPPQPVKDVPGFLLEHAPLEGWEWEILSMIREEAYYFAPQRQTKIMNEGWACVAAETPVFTERGLMAMKELVGGKASRVWDGGAERRVTDRNVIPDHPVITMTTRRGLRLTGSTNHRVMLAGGGWRRLDEIAPGERVAISGGGDRWPRDEMRLDWRPPVRTGLADVAQAAGVSVWTVLRHRAGRPTRSAAAIAAALEEYEAEENQALPQAVARRAPVRIPGRVDAELGAFLGYLIGDGHVSRVKRQFGLTTGDEEQAHRFLALGSALFEARGVVRRDGGRWRVLFHSETISDFLVEALGVTTGPSARAKRVPAAILRSPEPVVRAFLRALFDADGHAGATGVILASTSRSMVESVQLLLLNCGILSRVRAHKDGCFHVHVAGQSAARFAAKIGFGLERKTRALSGYVAAHRWFKREIWEDEVVSLEPGRATVYDVTVEATHRYAAAGLVNHNSYWHSTIMTEKALKDGEVVDYAERHAGTMAMAPGSLNPYKLGLEIFRDIEDRWNRGAHGPEFDECQDIQKRARWDLKKGEGRAKIFEVRRVHNDVTFVDAYLTEEFCRKNHFFVYAYDEEHKAAHIQSRDFARIKEQILFGLTNFGQPFIYVEDANYGNRGELLLTHRHEGYDLKLDWARDTLERLAHIWRRPVRLLTVVNGKGKLLGHDGESWSAQDTGEREHTGE